MLVEEIPPKIKIYEFILNYSACNLFLCPGCYFYPCHYSFSKKYTEVFEKYIFYRKICSEIIKLRHKIILMTSLRSQRES